MLLLMFEGIDLSNITVGVAGKTRGVAVILETSQAVEPCAKTLDAP